MTASCNEGQESHAHFFNFLDLTVREIPDLVAIEMPQPKRDICSNLEDYHKRKVTYNLNYNLNGRQFSK